MPVFSLQNNVLTELKEKNFDLEKDLQILTEKNLSTLFNLNFVRSEFSLNGLRIDTLAFDKESKSFTVMEYKNDKNFSVIDQGYAYLALMLNNKAEFILEYNESCNNSLKREDVDWSQSKVIFLAPTFTSYQQKAVHFKDLPIELWEVKLYENNSVLYNQLKSPESNESISKISKGNETLEKVSKEIKVYTEEDHLSTVDENIQEIYRTLREKVLELGNDIDVVPRKYYIGFKRKTNFLDIEFQKSKLKIYLNLRKGQLEDPEGWSRDVSEIGHWGNGDYEIHLNNKFKVIYLIELIKQSYEKNLV